MKEFYAYSCPAPEFAADIVSFVEMKKEFLLVINGG